MTAVLFFIAARIKPKGKMIAIQPLFPLLDVSRISAVPERTVKESNMFKKQDYSVFIQNSGVSKAFSLELEKIFLFQNIFIILFLM